MKKIMIFLMAVVLAFSLAACAGQPSSDKGGESGHVSETPNSENTDNIEEQSVPENPTESSALDAPENGTKLYVGTADAGFQEYPVEIDGDITPDALIDAMETLTGWDLARVDAVTSGKGGMTVCFAETGSLFVGPPEPQKDEFHMYDQNELAQTILDSIKKTLQMNFVMEPGDPDNLDVFYCMGDNQPLEIASIEKSWTLEAPYTW